MNLAHQLSAVLRHLLSNGNGRWFGSCRWCHATSPTWPAPDDLRILALAQAAGWRTRQTPDGRHDLTCPRCLNRD